MKAIALIVTVSVAACTASTRFEPATGGDPEAGHAAIEHYGCGACHAIPGIGGFGGQVGPSLDGLAKRPFIAGHLPNTPMNLERWLRNPRGVVAHTAMPALGLSNQEARDVAAYLYTLE